MFLPKEIKIKPDTSTSIIVDLKDSKKMLPLEPEKEDLNIIYKKAKVTDGKNKWKDLDLHMNIMYHPNSKEATKIILVIPGGGFMRCDINTSLLLLNFYLILMIFCINNEN